MGSLISATASYLDARHHHGRWLVRIEDLDPQREQPTAAGAILTALEAHGLEWDGPVAYQSRRTDVYRHALRSLQAQGHVYRCDCSRREIRKVAEKGRAGPVYPGTCRERGLTQANAADRFRVPDQRLTVSDRLQGRVEVDLPTDIGDFVVRRRDGWFAYQLAVVVDDHMQKITHVVRGTDLLWLTAGQCCLQASLGYRQPAYCHVPIATNARGQKLSKQTGAKPLETGIASANLMKCLVFLGQNPPSHLAKAAPEQILAWAVSNWDPSPLRAVLETPLPA